MIKRLIHFVGNNSFNSYAEDFYVKENAGELEDSLEALCKISNIYKMYIMPNFKFGWLGGPSGYTASIPRDNPYQSDLFSCEKFRVIMAAEVMLAEKDLDEFFLEQAGKNLSLCFPTQSFCPPTIDDNYASGWHAALGRRGCSIGLYQTTEKNDETGERFQRYYIIVNTSLPDKTLNDMNEVDKKITLNNLKCLDTYKFVTKHSDYSSEVLTVGEAFSGVGINNRMLHVSLENARRLIVKFADIIGVSLYRPVTAHGINDLANTNNTTSVTFSESDLNYKPINGIKDKANDALLAIDALKHWPKDVLLHADSYLPINKKIPPKFHNYPIGNIVLTLMETDPDIEDELEEMEIKFSKKPKTTKEDIYNDYNTFRFKDDRLCWYSNCTPTKKAHNGILVSDGLEGGYYALKQSFMIPRKGELYAKDTTYSSYNTGFQNDALDGFPIVWPFKHNTHRKIQEKSLDIFFDSKNSTKPGQLMGTQTINRKLMDKGAITESLGANYKHSDVLNFTPVKVLVSDLPMDSPTYELK